MGAVKEMEFDQSEFMRKSPRLEFRRRLKIFRESLGVAFGRYQSLQSPIDLGLGYTGYTYERQHPVKYKTLRVSFGQNEKQDMMLEVQVLHHYADGSVDSKEIESLRYLVRVKDIVIRRNGKDVGHIDGEHHGSDREDYIKVETFADEVTAGLDKRIKRRSVKKPMVGGRI